MFKSRETEEKMEDWLNNKPDVYKTQDLTLYALVKAIVDNKETFDKGIIAEYIHKYQPEWGERRVEPLSEQKDKELFILTEFYKFLVKKEYATLRITEGFNS
jgi:hypothetical protein